MFKKIVFFLVSSKLPHFVTCLYYKLTKIYTGIQSVKLNIKNLISTEPGFFREYF